MPHFILRFHDPGVVHAADVQRIRSLPDVTILDEGSPRMILVDGPEAALRAVVQQMPGWIIVPEQTVPLPDSRKRVRRPPDAREDDSPS
jgi:hypothetical protein